VTPTAETERLHLAGERLPFAMLPRWLLYHPDVNEGAKFLYCVLHDLVQGREGPTRPVTRAQLAAACGVSADTIDRRLAQLVSVGAVEKEHQIRAGGQQANVYRVWLTPPDGIHRTPATAVENGGRSGAAPVEGGANDLVERSRESAAPPAEPHGCGTSGRAGAAPDRKEEKNKEVPPQPPRRAGGHEIDGQAKEPRLSRAEPEVPPRIPSVDFNAGAPGQFPGPLRSPRDGEERSAGRSSRAQGTNPRAEADRADQVRVEAEAEIRRVELERAAASRRAEERAAALESDRLEAEALAVSAALDDDTLAAVVAAVRPALSGPLAASGMAVARAVVGWCRLSVAEHGGEFDAAVVAGLAAGLPVGEGTAAPLALPVAAPGTASLRARIGLLVKPVEGA
jgi:hypothetical protein